MRCVVAFLLRLLSPNVRCIIVNEILADIFLTEISHMQYISAQTYSSPSCVFILVRYLRAQHVNVAADLTAVLLPTQDRYLMFDYTAALLLARLSSMQMPHRSDKSVLSAEFTHAQHARAHIYTHRKRERGRERCPTLV